MRCVHCRLHIWELLCDLISAQSIIQIAGQKHSGVYLMSLDVVVHFLVFLWSFRFKSFLSQFSPFVAQIKDFCSDPGFFLLTMLASGCFSHCCVEGGDHWIYVCIFVAHDGERCKLPAYHSLTLKLKDPKVLETFQAMIGGRSATPTIVSNEYTAVDSMITTFNTAVTKTASKIFGKHRQKKKKTWVTAEILDLCDKWRELRKKRFEPEGSEKYKEVNNNIKRCMKKAEENCIGNQCSEIEENLRKNNSKRAY